MSSLPHTLPCDLDAFRATAAEWLATNATLRPPAEAIRWGEGSFDVSVFHNVTFEEERAVLDAAMAWQQRKYDAGFGAIDWPEGDGGAGLGAEHAQVFSELEHEYAAPTPHETFSVTRGLVAPTIREFGTEQQKREVMPLFLRTSQLCCQLFSEPGAGSDLAALSTRAVRDGDQWVVNGQKIWSSGARFSQWGLLIARTDPDVPKHAGQTAFIIPMDLPGITIVPIRQMSGGASFNEVFFDDVRLTDEMRLGEVGQGWKVALTTLGFERSESGSNDGVGGSWEQVLALALHCGATADPVLRQELAELYAMHRVRQMNAARTEAELRASGVPGPGGSLGKLLWTIWMTKASHVVSRILGMAITADTGAWGSFQWNDHVLGAPGYRIAGGSDEIQRNIIGERVLGLPAEPRNDRNTPFRDVPR